MSDELKEILTGDNFKALEACIEEIISNQAKRMLSLNTDTNREQFFNEKLRHEGMIKLKQALLTKRSKLKLKE